MKNILILMLIFAEVIFSQENHFYGPVKENEFTTWIKETSSQPRFWVEDHKCGAWSSSLVRNINFWTWTYNDIPTEATVVEVTIKFRADKYSPYQNFHVSFHNIQYPYGSSVNYYDECKSSNAIYEANISDDDGLVLFDKTFTQNDGSGVVEALNSAVQSGNYFFTLGIKALGDDILSPAWSFRDYNGNGASSDPAIDLIVKYETEYQNYKFTNKIGNELYYGDLILDDDIDQPLASGSIVGLSLNSIHKVRTAEVPFIIDWQGSETMKHIYWLEGGDNKKYELNNIFSANLNNTPSDMEANFNSTSNAQIELNFPEGASGGVLKFRDPWYYYQIYNGQWFRSDSFNEYQNPLIINNSSLDSYGGVFLEQTPDPQNPDKPYYSVKAENGQTVNINGRDHKFYFQNWEAEPEGSATFQDDEAEETAVVFHDAGATVKAVMKGTQLSDDASAYSNSGQRKVLRTSDGNIYHVYESMGKVWLEKSTDEGNSWTIMNGGSPVNAYSGITAKSPSLAIDNENENNFYLIYQEYEYFIADSKVYNFVTAEYYIGGQESSSSNTTIATICSDDYPDLQPTIAKDQYDSKLLIVWRVPSGSSNSDGSSIDPGLYYYYGEHAGGDANISWVESGKISNTSGNSSEPALAIEPSLNKTQPVFYPFQLVWTENLPAPIFGSGINYFNVNHYTNHVEFTDYEVISSGSGFQYNYSPSIAVIDNYPIVSWIGRYEPQMPEKISGFGGGQQPRAINAIVRKNINGTWYEKFLKYGNDVSFQNINRSDDGEYILSFTEEDADNFYVKSDEYNTVYAMVSSGEELQLVNETDLVSMFAIVYNHENLPYYFNKDDLELSAKPNSILTSSAREGMINKGAGEFYFVAGDMFLDGAPLEFEDISVEEDIDDLDELNYYLQTKPFALSDNSDLVFSVLFGITDSLKAYNALGENENVRFTMQMTDAETGEVIGTYDDVTYDKNNLNWYDNIAYQVETAGIGDRTVRLRLQVETNVEGSKYILGELFAEEHVLGKTNRTVVPFQGANAVTEYKLAQNYPNPFNPATTIKYEIPETGFVTLKIYDILGREVTTLVNAKQEAGRYEAKFNAKGLSSGIYIYRIQAGKFAESKKMILLK